MATGRGAVATSELTTVANAHWGIGGGEGCTVGWAYIGRATRWEQLPPLSSFPRNLLPSPTFSHLLSPSLTFSCLLSPSLRWEEQLPRSVRAALGPAMGDAAAATSTAEAVAAESKAGILPTAPASLLGDASRASAFRYLQVCMHASQRFSSIAAP